MTGDFRLEDYFGVLEEDTADELERIVAERREVRSEVHCDRVVRIVEALEE